jgi:ribosomal protein S28E/S33
VLVLLLAGSAAHARGGGQESPGEAVVPDSIAWEMMVGRDRERAGWIFRNDETGAFVRSVVHGREVAEELGFTASTGTFVDVQARLAEYRALARAGEGCPVGESDFLAFRLVWRERGLRHTATFSDSCGGVPVGFLETMRPINQRFDRLLLPSRGNAASE